MHLQIPHKTTAAVAAKRVQDGLAQHRAQLSEHAKINEERWEGNTLYFAVELQGKEISGSLAVTDTDYVLDAKLPLLWRVFEGRIQSEIEKQIKDLQ